MHVEIDENTSAVINQLISKGQFDNPMHVIQHAVHTLSGQQDPMSYWDQNELRAEIQKGLDDVKAGRVLDGEEVFH